MKNCIVRIFVYIKISIYISLEIPGLEMCYGYEW